MGLAGRNEHVRHSRTVAVLSAATALISTTLAFSTHVASAAEKPAAVLTGTLRLAPGSCAGGTATGTYFRMILPSGGVNGPYMSNSDSRCSDQSFTPLSPGTDGGLRIGSYQPVPSPAFASNGDAKANRVTAPQAFYGTSFATATNPTDPQTRTKVPAPRLTLSGSTLSGDLRAFSVTWNNQHFNQGAPKPNGSFPGVTRAPTGTYDARTGAFTLDWTSQIVGGPFDRFTGKWHLEGRFEPTAGSTPAQTVSGGSHGTTAGGTGSGGSVGSGTTSSAGGPSVAGPGAPTPGAPVAGTDPSAGVPAAAAGTPTTTTDTVTKQDWSVSWPVIWLTGGIAVLGFGALIALSLLARKRQVA